MTNTIIAICGVAFWTGMLIWFIRTVTEASLIPTQLTWIITLAVLGWVTVAFFIILDANPKNKRKRTGG